MAIEFTKLSEVEQVETVSDNASVLVEEDGEIKRMPSNLLGGSQACEIINLTVTYPEDASPIYTVDKDYSEILAAVESGKSVYINYYDMNILTFSGKTGTNLCFTRNCGAQTEHIVISKGNTIEIMRYFADGSQVTWQDLYDEATGIYFSGTLPEGSVLSASYVNVSNIHLDTAKYPLGQNTVACDISVTKNGVKFIPEGETYVQVPENAVLFNFASGYMIYNVNGDNVEVIGPIVYTGGFINMPFENKIGTLIYSDVFPTASNVSFETMFSKNNVTVYEAPFESAKTHTIENGLDITIYPEFSYTDTNGVTWYKFYNDNLVNEGDPEYLYVKAEDINEGSSAGES